MYNFKPTIFVTGLSKPAKFFSSYNETYNTSMTVRWEKVKKAEEYLILVFDCSKQSNERGLVL